MRPFDPSANACRRSNASAARRLVRARRSDAIRARASARLRDSKVAALTTTDYHATCYLRRKNQNFTTARFRSASRQHSL
ncbi:MAG: hypothetical protein RL380_882 [Verrucomicrobiota bacterium]|jgi:hypothetical protein